MVAAARPLAQTFKLMDVPHFHASPIFTLDIDEENGGLRSIVSESSLNHFGERALLPAWRPEQDLGRDNQGPLVELFNLDKGLCAGLAQRP